MELRCHGGWHGSRSRDHGENQRCSVFPSVFSPTVTPVSDRRRRTGLSEKCQLLHQTVLKLITFALPLVCPTLVLPKGLPRIWPADRSAKGGIDFSEGRKPWIPIATLPKESAKRPTERRLLYGRPIDQRSSGDASLIRTAFTVPPPAGSSYQLLLPSMRNRILFNSFSNSDSICFSPLSLT